MPLIVFTASPRPLQIFSHFQTYQASLQNIITLKHIKAIIFVRNQSKERPSVSEGNVYDETVLEGTDSISFTAVT